MGKDPGKNAVKDVPAAEKGVAPAAIPPGAPVGTPPGAPGTTPVPSPADSAAAASAAKPATSAPPEKPAPEAAAKPEAPDKPESAAKPGAGPSRPAAEPWKPATEPAAAASAPRPEAARPESTRPGSEQPPGEGPEVPRSGGPGGGTPQPPAQSPPRRRQGCLALIALLVILAVGGIVTWPYWSPTVAPFVQDYLPARPADEQIASLQERIAELEQAALRQEDVRALQQDAQMLREQMNTLIGRLQDVEPGVTAVVPEWIDERLNELRSQGRQLGQNVVRLDERVAGFNEQLDGIEQRVDGLGEQITRLDEQLTGLGDEVSDLGEQMSGLGAQVGGFDEQIPAVEEQVTGLEEQVRTLSQQVRATRDVTEDAAAIALGLSRLSETVGTSRAYREELDAFKNAADAAVLDDESLEPLEAYAETGVPTFADLYRRFPEMADAVVRAGVEANDDGALQTTFNRLRSLVTVRRTGEAALEAGGSDAVLEMARLRMDAGDLPGAIDAVEQLEGAPAEAAVWWLNAARSRLAVQRAMERIHIRAIATLSSKEG